MRTKTLAIIDLDHLKRDGLNPQQVAADVARLLGYGETCEGPLVNSRHTSGYTNCTSCARTDVSTRPAPVSHKRIPLPVDAVRLELLMWLIMHDALVAVNYSDIGGCLHIAKNVLQGGGAATVYFTTLTDEALALSVAAVELFKEKE